MTKQVTDKEFKEEILDAKKPVLVDFWAEWCGPCKMLSPIIDQIADEMKNKVKVVKMNIDENPESPSSLGVRGIPTLMIFKDGKQVSVKVGMHPKNSVVEWINSSI